MIAFIFSVLCTCCILKNQINFKFIVKFGEKFKDLQFLEGMIQIT